MIVHFIYLCTNFTKPPLLSLEQSTSARRRKNPASRPGKPIGAGGRIRSGMGIRAGEMRCPGGGGRKWRRRTTTTTTTTKSKKRSDLGSGEGGGGEMIWGRRRRDDLGEKEEG